MRPACGEKGKECERVLVFLMGHRCVVHGAGSAQEHTAELLVRLADNMGRRGDGEATTEAIHSLGNIAVTG